MASFRNAQKVQRLSTMQVEADDRQCQWNKEFAL